MINVVGIRFRNVGKVYYFNPQNFEIKSGDRVIVETARGLECGIVALESKQVEEEDIVRPLRDVLRIATTNDLQREASNRSKEKEAIRICKAKIEEHKLVMKLIGAEYTFDNSKLLFYFTADGRIDFRELVKDLAAIFRVRIELRQIGVRDETRILGSIGICGRALCCHTYLPEFAPVSIKMAKEQNLSLNQTKISGVCGRLMCCLKNEQETYEELNKTLPKNGDTVVTSDDLTGTVHSVNVLRQHVKVFLEINNEKEIREYPVEELTFVRKGKKDNSQNDGGKADKQKGNKPQADKANHPKGKGNRPQEPKEQNGRSQEGKGQGAKGQGGKSQGNRSGGKQGNRGNSPKPQDGKAPAAKANATKQQGAKPQNRQQGAKPQGNKPQNSNGKNFNRNHRKSKEIKEIE